MRKASGVRAKSEFREQINSFYSQICFSYNELHGEEQRVKARTIIENVRPSGLLLDVGAGTGVSTAEFKECTCIALDPNIEMLKQFKGLKVCGRAERLPFKGNAFDCVVSITALHHTRLKRALSEIKRTAKQNAKIAISFFKRAASFKQAEKTLSGFKRIEEKFDVVFIKQ